MDRNQFYSGKYQKKVFFFKFIPERIKRNKFMITNECNSNKTSQILQIKMIISFEYIEILYVCLLFVQLLFRMRERTHAHSHENSKRNNNDCKHHIFVCVSVSVCVRTPAHLNA